MGRPIKKAYLGIFSKMRALNFYILLLLLTALLASIFHISDANAEADRLQLMNYSMQTVDESLYASICRFLNSNMQSSDFTNELISAFYSPDTHGGEQTEQLRALQSRLVNMARTREFPGRLLLYRASDAAVITTFSEEIFLTKDHPASAFLSSPALLQDPYAARFLSTGENSLFYYCPKYPVRLVNGLSDCALLILDNPETLFGDGLRKLFPAGTFCILCDNAPVASTGGGDLTAKDIAAVFAQSHPSDRFFTCKGKSIGKYRFYSYPSSCSNLLFFYYEPARQAWGAKQLPLLFFASCYVILFIIATILGLEQLRSCRLSLQNEESSQAKKAPSQAVSMPVLTTAKYPPHLQKYDFSSPHFSGCVIEYRAETFRLLTIAEQDKVLAACDRYLSDSYISYQLEPYASCLICCFNFNEYNTRTLTNALRQILASRFEDILFNFYDTSVFFSLAEVRAELTFLQDIMMHSAVWGFGKHYGSTYLKQCSNADETVVGGDALFTLHSCLRKNDFDGALAYLEEKRSFITDYIKEELPLSPVGVYNLVNDTFSSVRLFFEEKNYHCPSLPEATDDLLLTCGGARGALKRLSAAVAAYRDENTPSASSYEQDLIQSVLQYIGENLATVTLSLAAEHFHVSSAHLSRLFKKNMGKNFSEYVSDQKMEKASHLLMESSLSVADISARLGYSTPSYFLARFKDAYGTTPSAYRKAHSLTKSDL